MQERKLQFVEGTSSKFWHAKQDGATLTVTYGRIGTAGQVQEKTFGSDAEAESAFAKQVAEKVKKGYADDDAVSGAPAATAATPAPKKVAAPPKPAAEPLLAPTPTFDADPPRRLRLSPKDFPVGSAQAPRRLTGRPATRPFDLESCIARLVKLYESGNVEYPHTWPWEKADIDVAISRPEAHFWLNLLQLGLSGKFPKKAPQVVEWARKQVCDGTIPLSEVLPDGNRYYYGYPKQAVVPVFVLYGVDGLVEYLGAFQEWYVQPSLAGAKELVVPYLTDAEMIQLREGLLNLIRTQKEPPMWAMMLTAEMAGGEETLKEVVTSWPDGSGRPRYFGGYGSNTNLSLRVALGIGDPDTVAREVRRLDAVPNSTEDVRSLLAVTEFRALDVAARGVLAQTTKADAEKLTNALALAEGPEAAPAMLEILLESRSPKPARDWLETFPAFAIEGLAPLLITSGKRADATLELLRNLKKQGAGELMERKAATLAEPVAAALREKVLAWTEVVHPPLADDEAPDWVVQVFGGKLTIPDAPAVENPPHRLNLTDSDRPRRKPVPEPRPVPPQAPFDLERCMSRFLQIGAPTDQTWRWKWEKIELDVALSRQEAHFWNEALRLVADHSSTLHQGETRLRAGTYTGDVPLKDTALPLRTGNFAALAMRVAWTLHGIDGLMRTFGASINWPAGIVEIFEKSVLPWLPQAQRDELLKRVTAKAKLGANPENWALLLGACLGMPAETLRDAVARWPDATDHGRWYRVQNILAVLLHLDEPALVARHAGRLRAYIGTATEARAFLAASDGLGAAYLAQTVADAWGDNRDALARTLLTVELPSVAPTLLGWGKQSSLKRLQRDWLDRNPALAVEGLAPETVKSGKDADPAINHLREMTRRGWRWLIEKKCAGMAPEIAAAVKTKVLDYDPAKSRKPTPADTKLAALLPPIAVRTPNGPRRLTDTQQAQVIALLRTTPLVEPSPELALLRDGAERAALDTFVWKLFDDWLSDGGPSKDRWKMEALGHLGGDAIALKLAPLVRIWPGESQHPRAILGLDILRAIGTDTALMQIHGISQKLSFKALKQRAGECLEAIAADRELTTEELADRIIPDGGLDERGGFTFDFGPRQFDFLLGPDLKPLVRDADGQRRPDLPKPTQKDDPEKAAAAQAQWKLLKKQVADVAKVQAVRLEQAMVLGRRWTPEELQTLFVEHPLMVHLVRRLIWGAYDEQGKPLASFRVCDDNTLAGSDDSLFTLPDTATRVGVIHPSHLSEAERGAWGEILADYELISPFVQLGRTIYTLTDEERKSRRIARFDNIKVDPKTLVFGLENLAWLRGQPQDGGSFASHHKVFGDIVAVTCYADGVWVGTNGDDWDDQVMEGVGFLRDLSRARDGWFGQSEFDQVGILLGEIDPVVMSEVLYDVSRLVAKGRKA